MTSSPMGPEPMTAQRMPGWSDASSTAWSATASGSMRLASPSPTDAGSVIREVVRPGHPAPEAAVGRAVTGETYRGAELGGACQARRTRLTWIGRVDRHPCPRPRTRLDHAGDLVPQDEWPLEPRVADGTFLVPMEVRTAQAHRGHPDQHLTVGRRGSRLIVEANVETCVETGDGHQRVGR